MVSVGLGFVPLVTMTYVSDCYLPVNADALELVNGLKVIRSLFAAVAKMLTSAEHCRLWVLVRRHPLGDKRWLYQYFRNSGGNIRSGIIHLVMTLSETLLIISINL